MTELRLRESGLPKVPRLASSKLGLEHRLSLGPVCVLCGTKALSCPLRAGAKLGPPWVSEASALRVGAELDQGCWTVAEELPATCSMWGVTIPSPTTCHRCLNSILTAAGRATFMRAKGARTV